MSEKAKEYTQDILKEELDKVKTELAAELKGVGEVVAKAVAESMKAMEVERKATSGVELGNEPLPESIRPENFFKSVFDAAINPSVKSKLVDDLTSYARVIKAPSGASTIVDSDGGYLVPEEIKADILEKTYETGQITSQCDRYTTESNLVKWNALKEDDRSTDGSYGGIRAYRKAEGGSGTSSKPNWEQHSLSLEKLFILVYATEEVLTDAKFFSQYVNRNAPKAFNKKLDSEIWSGTGAGQCKGILNSGALVSVAAEAGQAADTILFENVTNMLSRFEGNINRAKWYINRECLPQLSKMNIAVGTGGSAVWLPGGNIAGAPFGTLYGIPVVTVNAAKKLGDLGDIVLADMSEYMLLDKGGIRADVSMHVNFTTDEEAFRFIYRVNGKPKWDNAVTPENATSGKTVSPYVALAAR